MFDKRADYISVFHFSMICEERKLKAIAELEDKVLHLAETDLIFEALQRREFIEMEIRESVMWVIIKKKWENVDEHNPQAIDDATVILQFKMDSLSISIIMKMKIQEYELPVEHDYDS